jgi:hypothetical protein
MRTSFFFAAALALVALPAFAESHCSGAGPDNEVVAAVSVPGDFRSCLTKLMQGAKTKCAPGKAELQLTVNGTENGKAVDMRVLRIDCPTDGGKSSRPVPPNLPPPAKK